jgi:RNA polymerase sigma-70 factor (ECF subfamily)
MDEEHTSAVVQRYLDEWPSLTGGSPTAPVVRALLGRSVRRLHRLCATVLSRSYPRLTRPPLNLQADELLGAVVERLLKALREARPTSVRQFFSLACQSVPAPASSGSGLSPDARQMLEAIERLPQGEREAFELVRLAGMSQPEAARVLGVSVATVNRRLRRGLQLLADVLSDLYPDSDDKVT